MSLKKPTVLPVKAGQIPDSLKNINRWVCWKLDLLSRPNKPEKWAKVPYHPKGYRASSTNQNSWSTFEQVLCAYEGGGFEGIGVILGDGLHGVDLDDHFDPIDDRLDEFGQEIIDRVAGYCEVSPSGTGVKLFTLLDLDRSARVSEKDGLEVYRSGRFFTVTGWSLGGDLPSVEQDISWLIEKVWPDQPMQDRVVGDLLSLVKTPLEGWDEDRVRDELIPYVDVEMHYDDWIRYGQALHHQFDGSEDGFELWQEMFSSSSKAGQSGEEHDRYKWDSFHHHRLQGHGPVTLATLIKECSDRRKAAEASERAQMMGAIAGRVAACAAVSDLEDGVCRQLKRADLGDGEREQIAQWVKNRARELGVQLPINVIRRWMRPIRTNVADDAPDWLEPWVYVTDCDKFYNIDTRSEATAQGFRAMFNREMPIGEDGNRARADTFSLEMWNMPTVDHKMYLPSAGAVFEMLGQRWVNLYRPASVPGSYPGGVGDLSSIEQSAVGLVEDHFKRYFTDERERRLMLSWIAYNVQHPGQKIRWAPYIYGHPGDGKSFFGALLACAMGAQNVRPLNSSTLESNFNEWAVGSAVIFVEEMKQHGANRYDIMNKIKPVITNDQIEIHPKGRPSYSAPNTCNYVLFSNYLDGAPIESGDRRFMFVQGGMRLDQIREITEAGYFEDLFGALRVSDKAIRTWLLSVDIDPEFRPNGRAPLTAMREEVIEAGKDEIDFEIEDLVETGYPGLRKEYLVMSELNVRLQLKGMAVTHRQLVKKIESAGYLRGGRIKFGLKKSTLWLLPTVNTDFVNRKIEEDKLLVDSCGL
jgi:hypothetical protein